MNKYTGADQMKKIENKDEDMKRELKDSIEMRLGKKTNLNMGQDANAGQEALDIAKKLIIDRQLDGGRMGINDDKTNTNLISKHYSPMFIRKFNIINGWPCWVGMICDEDVSDIDKVVNSVVKAAKEAGMITNNLQNMRNFTGILAETIIDYYNNKKAYCVEGVAITLYVDKAYIQNMFGDFMNHTSCRIEYAGALGMLPHI